MLNISLDDNRDGWVCTHIQVNEDRVVAHWTRSDKNREDRYPDACIHRVNIQSFACSDKPSYVSSVIFSIPNHNFG